MKWDFFICHASEDKEEIVRPLANHLINLGFHVWFDEISLKLGDSLSKSIDNGIANSRYGIIVLSSNFFAKQWPQRELHSLASMEMVKGEKRILPIWHNINGDDISKFSPMLADKVGVSTSKGINNVIEEIKRAFSYSEQNDTLHGASEEVVFINGILKPIIESLVDNIDVFSLSYIEGDRTTVIELTVFDDKQWGWILGKQGRIAKAIRTLLTAIGQKKFNRRLVLELIEP